MRKSEKRNRQRRIKICLIAGARPNFMKIAPIVRAVKKHNRTAKNHQPKIDFVLIHTGQHYDYEMSSVFFEELKLPEPDIHLNVGSGTHGEQTGRIMISFEKVLLDNRPDIVVVVGDVNSTLACALVAAKLHIPIAHVEAGLRSFDRRMPEEINRILTDQLADHLFTPSPDGDENLRKEGIPSDKVFCVGDIMVDNLFFNLPKAGKSGIFRRLGLIGNGSSASVSDYGLLTLHRPANVEDKTTLTHILDALQVISKDLPIIFPVHPRTQKMISSFRLEKRFGMDMANLQNNPKISNSINAITPLGYFDFLALMSKAKVVFTDSGGIQEETTVLGIPCLTLRDTTERPITLNQGSNILVGDETDRIIKETRKILRGAGNNGNCPKIWDGKTAERIVEILCRNTYQVLNETGV